MKMKFTSAYEPAGFEPEIYAAWEASGAFLPAKKPEAVYEKDLGDNRLSVAPSGQIEQIGGAEVAGRVGEADHKQRARLEFSGTNRIRVQSKRGLKKYSIIMPPPNANGNLHIGHGLTIAIEDALTRYYRLRGRRTWYVPGADHAGFETWVVYEKALEKTGKTRFMYSREELYAKVWDFVQEQRGGMELQVRSLGASCSWKDLTFTLDENVVRRVYTTFEKMWKEGLIYRGEKLINYCTKHQTAFADIEVVYDEEEGKLWDIAYPYDGGEIVVSTTRPETLFGDTAVAVNPEDERYKHLKDKMVKLPLTRREIPVIFDEHADPEYGTGAVKITPAHDFDDFEVGKRNDLNRLTVISFDGKMLPVCGEEFMGLTVKECRKKVVKELEKLGLIRGERRIKHSVAHCYKCNETIEPLLMNQWFIDTGKLSKMAVEQLEDEKIKFFPESKGRVLINYLKGLKDWNISRQIPWGIAIPMFYKVDPEEEGPEWMFDTRTELKEIEIGGVRYKRDEDTFDTWFSSSHWPIVCTNWEEGFKNEFYPLNVMETGADILFAWVARMIMVGLYVTGEVPFREVYLHGLVLDEHGKKMSKSKGNVINPLELVSKYGSDAFRLGILRGRSAGMNQAFSENSVVSGRNLCNKLWNISRFVQGLVDEEKQEKGYSSAEVDVILQKNEAGANHATASDSINPSVYEYTTNNLGEDWICRELDRCRSMVEQDMAEYRFAEAVEVLYSTIWDKYADWFIESQKIYKNIPLLKVTLETILVMLHPFAPFVTEAIWQNLSWTEGLIMEEKWPSRLSYDVIPAENFERLKAVVIEVRGTLQALSGLSKGKKYGLLYGDSVLVESNSLLVKNLSKVPSVESCGGAPRGLRVALVNHELYLDVPVEVVVKYKTGLMERILAVGRELDGLNMRMMNPRYVEKAPAELVAETRKAIVEKERLIEKLKQQVKII